MHHLVQTFEKKQMHAFAGTIKHPKFRTGDTLRITINIEEGVKKWTQTCEGVCISMTNKGIASSLVIRKLDPSGAIKLRFPLWLQGLTIHVIKLGIVKRAKLYYLDRCSRKQGRIRERIA
jgi:large subunit ribosomal protein L19